METSLHRQLKLIYADSAAEIEAPLQNYRIDVVCDGELIEIQHGSLAAIRRKVATLLETHRVLVVKPIIHRRKLIKQQAKGGRVISRRMSPKRGRVIDVFDELIYFRQLFPHTNLAIEVPLVDVEELRYPGHGKRRRRRQRDHQIEDQRLIKLHQVHRFSTAADLLRLVPKQIPEPFHTGQLAEQLNISRWMAQRVTYCLRHMGGLETAGKQGNAKLYRRCA